MIDISKPYACRNGWAAKVIKAPNGWLYGYIEPGEGLSESVVWFPSGKAVGRNDDHLDLVNVPEQRSVKGWAALREGEKPTPWQSVDIFTGTRPDKHTRNALNIIAMREITVDFTIGEGLGDKP
jgi:hypothetical protein